MFFGGVEVNPLLLIGVGMAVGVCSGFFGFGGGFMLTPALNILGMPMSYAIGTGLAMMAGSSVMSTMKHRKFGHVDVRLGASMVGGTAIGVEVGKQLVMYMEGMGNVDVIIRWIYVGLLGGLGLYMLREARKAAAPAQTLEAAGPQPAPKAGLAAKIKNLNVPPFVSLPVSGIPRISIWVPLGIAFSTGLLAGLLGVGGGFIRMPSLVYLMGVPTVVAVGTDLFEIMISGNYGAFTYALSGRLELLGTVMLMLGASAGVQVGAAATRCISADRIRQYFALTILFAGLSVLIEQGATIIGWTFLNTLAGFMLLSVASAMSALIVVLFLKAKLGRGLPASEQYFTEQPQEARQ